MGQHKKITPEIKKLFCETIAEHLGIAKACREIGIARSAFYAEREKDPQFKKDWDDAVAEACELAEEELFRRAVHGVTKPIYQGGRHMADLQEFSDGLLTTFLKAHYQRYKDKVKVDQSVTGDLSVEHSGRVETIILPAKGSGWESGSFKKPEGDDDSSSGS
jgi:hypothetical protein